MNRLVSSQSARINLIIISSQVIVSEDRLSTVGHKFYCTIRANHYVNRGTWYYEAKIVDLPEGAATRIGWAQRNANLQVSRIRALIRELISWMIIRD